MEERDTRQAFAEPVFPTGPSTSSLAENEKTVENQLAMLGGGFDTVENEVDFKDNMAYSRKQTTVLEESEAQTSFKLNPDPLKANKQSMQSAGSFEMPSEPIARKTALITPKNMGQNRPAPNFNQKDLDFAMEMELRNLRTYFLNGEFRKANNFLHEKLVRPEGEVTQDQRMLYNICLIYVTLKLKEYENARTFAEELL